MRVMKRRNERAIVMADAKRLKQIMTAESVRAARTRAWWEHVHSTGTVTRRY